MAKFENEAHVVEVGIVGGKRECAADHDVPQFHQVVRPGGQNPPRFHALPFENATARMRADEVAGVLVPQTADGLGIRSLDRFHPCIPLRARAPPLPGAVAL